MAKPTVLFLTNREMGQATVCLAVAHEFLIRQTHAVHIASFSPLEAAVSQLSSEAATLTRSAASTATFHILPGRTMVDTIAGSHTYKDAFSTHDIGFLGARRAYNKLCEFAVPWTGDEYIAVYHKCIEIIKNVKPTIVVVEPLFAQGIDACRTLACNYVILSPNTPKDHVVQPMLGNLWKYPIICSGYPFPLPWRHILPNIYLAFSVGTTIANSPVLKTINDRRHAEGINGPYPIMTSYEKGSVPMLLASHTETDFPCFVPENITQCGPILRPCGQISMESPELATWLSQGPTVLVNLGSNVYFSKDQARKFADGLRVLLVARPDIQVLWKLKPKDWIPTALCNVLREVTAGRVRVEEWLPVEPSCILQSGHVCCMVHHGGANSYNEAMRAGVPQIVLPVWFDTYDFAARVEYLGVGVWGSKTSAPGINGPELGEAFIRVLESESSSTMREKAKVIASKLASSEGRVMACEKIIELMEG